VSSLTGEVNGFILDRGLHIYFSADVSDKVMEILSIGSRVSVDGCMRISPVGDTYLDATRITSLDSRRSVESCCAPFPQTSAVPSVTGSPEHDTASSAPLECPDCAIQHEIASPRNRTTQAIDLVRVTNETRPVHAVRSPDDSPTYAAPPTGEVPRGTAASGIGQALNSLHHTEALLVYLLVVNSSGPSVGHQLFNESVRTYEQALSRIEMRDFTGAQQFAMASRFLSRAAEIMILRTMPRKSNHVSRESACHKNIPTIDSEVLAQDQLKRVEELLSPIRLVVDNGAASTTDCAQIQKLALRGEILYGQARCFFYDGRIEDAIELAHAAEAVARALERLCQANCLMQDTNAS